MKLLGNAPLGHLQYYAIYNLEVQMSERCKRVLVSLLVPLINPLLQVIPAATSTFTSGHRFSDCLDCFVVNASECLICSCCFESVNRALNVILAFFDVHLTLEYLKEWFCEAENLLKDPEL